MRLMRFELEIPGIPIAKHRPRFSTRGKFPVAYNDQRREEREWRIMAKSALGRSGIRDFPVRKGVPVRLQVAFYMPVPKSFSNRKRNQLLGSPHVKKPDADNLVKFVKDCLNGIAWHDDSQVWVVEARKVYGPEPKTEISLEWEDSA